MDCKTFQQELPDLVLNPAAQPSPAGRAHLKICPPCSEELLSFQSTLAVLDAWTAPEPSPYFDQKLAVRLREEQAAPRMSWFERVRTSLLFNTGRNFRPALAGSLALALFVSAGSVVGINSFRSGQSVQASATIDDLQILDHNEQAFQQMDELQQDQDSASPSSPGGEDSSQTPPPTT